MIVSAIVKVNSSSLICNEILVIGAKLKLERKGQWAFKRSGL